MTTTNATQIASELKSMSPTNLRLRYQEVTGEQIDSKNKQLLIKKIVKALLEREGMEQAREEAVPSRRRGRRGSAQTNSPIEDDAAEVQAEGEVEAPASKRRERDPRLPPPGTVIEKLDRYGAARCKCKVEEAPALGRSRPPPLA